MNITYNTEKTHQCLHDVCGSNIKPSLTIIVSNQPQSANILVHWQYATLNNMLFDFHNISQQNAFLT
jgi:hypothetical protein